MVEREKRQQETIKTFIEGLGKKRSSKRLVEDGKINEEALLDALTLAFPDITPRTMKRDPDWQSTEKCVEFSEMPRALFEHPYKGETFGNQLKGWFERPCPADPGGEAWEKAFDGFHALACETVLDFLTEQRYEPKHITYGKAQKVVNMTFKHIYCLDGAYIKEDWFIPCHIALDSFTLEWFCRNIKGITKGCVDSWSALQNVAEEIPNLPKGYAGMKMYSKTVGKEDKTTQILKYYTYSQIVSLIRSYFAGEHPFKGLCPLQAEFYIWPEIQLHLAAEALYGQNTGVEKAIEAAREEWQADWEKDRVESKEIDQQFKWCREKFKLLPVEKKLDDLHDHVDQIRRDVRIYVPQ